VLEVARDIKELKAYLMGGGPADVRSLPVYPAEGAPLAEQGTEIEYTESQTHVEPVEDVKPLRDVEREAIARALRTTGGHRKRAAKLLDMPERTLYRKIRQYGLS
jgi:DNA-binding NtrC family response regulator